MKQRRSLWPLATLAVASGLLWWLTHWSTSTREKVVAGPPQPFGPAPAKPTESVWATPTVEENQPTTASATAEPPHRKPTNFAHAGLMARASPASLAGTGASDAQGAMQISSPESAGTPAGEHLVVPPLVGSSIPDNVTVGSQSASVNGREPQRERALALRRRN